MRAGYDRTYRALFGDWDGERDGTLDVGEREGEREGCEVLGLLLGDDVCGEAEGPI